MPDMNGAAGALAGLRVLELANESGQYAGRLLADMGADVVKVEPPGGEVARRTGPFVDDAPHPDRSLFFWHYNFNKRSVTLNLETPDGRALLRQLAGGADVVLETFRPGYLPGLGLGYEALSAGHDGLIMCSLTPFGQTGPYRDFLASDLISLAMGGPMASCGYDDIPGAPPIRGNGYQGYQTGSHFAFMGILLALYWRDVSGAGQYIDASIHEACSSTTEVAIPAYTYLKKVAIRQTGRHAAIRRTRPWQFRCEDGVYVNLVGGVPRGAPAWRAMVDWMDGQGMAEDLKQPAYDDMFRKRTLAADDPMAAHVGDCMAAFFATMPGLEVYNEGQARGMSIGIVRAPEEALADPHFRHDRQFFIERYHEDIGRMVTYSGRPYVFDKTPWEFLRHAPRVGEHNVDILGGELGLTGDRLTVLAESGVI
ncbi:MAG: CoA transferase [Dehalococcoidia bacterium]|nr:CoA transferase [Dehalococcoidia bacterium]